MEWYTVYICMYTCVMMLLLFSYMESEHNFMGPYSQDDLVSVRNISIHTHVWCMYLLYAC